MHSKVDIQSKFVVKANPLRLWKTLWKCVKLLIFMGLSDNQKRTFANQSIFISKTTKYSLSNIHFLCDSILQECHF